MVIDILVDKWEVKATDIIHLNKFYIGLHDYLWREEYSEAKDAGFPEMYYWETRTQKGGNEIWVWWRPFRKIRSNSFYERFFVIDLHAVGMRKVDVIKANKKWTVDTGKVEVLVKVKLRLDPKNEWQNNWFLKSFLNVFYKRIYRKNIMMHKDELLKDSYKMQEFCKRLMDLNTFATPVKPYDATLGFIPNF